MTFSRPLLPKEYRLSDLRSQLDVSSVPDDERAIHTLFAVLINDVDRRADIHQSIKPEIMEGLAQAWLYFAENTDGVDVLVEQGQHGLSTEIDDPSDERPASSYSWRSLDDSQYDQQLRKEANVSIAQFERDMNRLDDLRRKAGHPGLNSIEDSEAKELREQYGLEHRDWWQREYLAEEPATDSTTVSPGAAEASR